MKIIVGLGNPGEEYRNTRHNVGYRTLDLLKKRFSVLEEYTHRSFRGWRIRIAGQEAVLVRSKTYMNESGPAVARALESRHETPENLIVVHDDLDIPLGKLKITGRSGPGGHKGMQSIIGELGTQVFPRVRIGIGRETIETSFVDYVLDTFQPEEAGIIEESIGHSADACLDIIVLGALKAMTKWNGL